MQELLRDDGASLERPAATRQESGPTEKVDADTDFVPEIGISLGGGIMGHSRSLGFGILGLALFALPASCNAGDQPAPSAPGGEPGRDLPQVALNLVVNDALPLLDPYLQDTGVGTWVLYGNVWESLIDIEDDQPVPQLASNWSQEDPLVWVFELRPDVRFHDGSVMTVEDVIASFERARSHPESAISPRVSKIEDVSARDSNTIVIRLLTPTPTLAWDLWEVPIVANASSAAPLDPPIATGPYRIVGHQIGERLLVKRFDEYWGDVPDVAQAEFLFEPDGDRRIEMLQEAQADLVTNLPPGAIDAVEERPDLWVESSLGGIVRFICFNPAMPPFDDPRIREAIDIGVDRQALVDGYYARNARVAGQIGRARSVGHLPYYEAPSKNLERAKELITQVAQGETLELTLHCGESQAPIAEVIAAQLKKVGLSVNVQPADWNEFYSDLQRGALAFSLVGWSTDIADVGPTYEEVIHTFEENGLLGKSNLGRYSNPEADRLIEAAIEESNASKRRQLLEEVSKIIVTDRPILPLIRELNLYGVRRSLSWVAPSDGVLKLSKMTVVEEEVSASDG